MVTANFLNSSEVTTDRLFQWDVGQKIQLLNVGSTTTPNVHFCNKKSDNALVVTTTGSNGTYTANIPNSLLAEEYDITAFIYLGNDTEAKTIKVVHIPITKRTKPSSYVYTTDKDVADFMAVSAEIHSLLDGLVITPYDNTKTYIKPNIVYYQGSTYICTSETDVTGVLPTNTDSWGLMCESGCNISTITFSNDTFHFTLQNNDVVDLPILSLTTTLSDRTVEEMVALNIKQDSNGVLKLGNNVIPQRVPLYKSTTLNGEALPAVITLLSPVKFGDVIEVEVKLSGAPAYFKFQFYDTNMLCAQCYPNAGSSIVGLSATLNKDSNDEYSLISFSAKQLSEYRGSTAGFQVTTYDSTNALFAIYKIIE